MSILEFIVGLFRKHKPKPGGVLNTVRPTVAIINVSTVMTDAQLSPIIQALQVQISSHFAPVWGVDCTLVQIPKGGKPPAGAWHMVIGDDSTQVSALGFHDETADGSPEGHVFAKTDLDNGCLVSVTLSHELTEMILNPDCNRVAQNMDGVFWSFEAADAVEADNLGYDVNSIRVSDFVLPAFFDPSPPTGTKFDYCGVLKSSFSLAPGGYTSVFDPNNPASGWTMITADRNASTLISSRGQVGSRRERIRTPRANWVRSTIQF